jgi:hypothetical protein
MPTERAILCGPASQGRLPVADARPLRLHLWGPHQNVYLTIEDVRRAMWREIPAAFLDLIDLATYVYCADQAVRRGGLSDSRFGQDWRRRFFFRVAVREPDLWGGAEVCDLLARTLGFLSEDEYHFDFEPLAGGRPAQSYFNFIPEVGGGDAEEVVLSSGGLDSLGGAVREAVTDGRRIALVNHRPTTKLANRQRALLAKLEGHAKENPPAYIPVRINKKKVLGCEHTQRSRSFLYASLGAAVATMLGLRRVRFYENGVVSLNLPPSAQVVGARATRTTHPQVLTGFSELFSRLAGRAFVVENPFRWETKAAVVRLIAAAGCRDLIRHTTSCTHTWEMTKEYSHCGACSQCIDRRFAVLAAGEEAADPAAEYRVDLLTGERQDGNPRTMLAAYLETASRIASMSAVEFFGRYGEASRVLRHAEGDPEATAVRVFNLYREHAREVNNVVDRALGRYAAQIRRRELPPSCLLRIVCETGATDTQELGRSDSGRLASGGPPLGENVFCKKGEAWQVRFACGQEFILLPSKGAAYLHLLLSKPGASFTVAALSVRVAKDPRKYCLGDAGEASDADALAAYRTRAQEAAEELREAQQRGDVEAQAELRGELEWIAEQVRKDRGYRGRARKQADDRERVRKRVWVAIRRAVGRIGRYDARLAEHLSPPRLVCGWNPCYTPGPGIRWET